MKTTLSNRKRAKKYIKYNTCVKLYKPSTIDLKLITLYIIDLSAAMPFMLRNLMLVMN